MKKSVVLLLCLCLLLTAAACGSAPDDPNAGVYECVSVEMSGISLDINEVYPDGVTLELKSGGKGTITMENRDFGLKWEAAEDKTLTLEIDGETSQGTIDNGVIVVDLMGMGMNFTFERGDAAAESEE